MRNISEVTHIYDPQSMEMSFEFRASSVLLW